MDGPIAVMDWLLDSEHHLGHAGSGELGGNIWDYWGFQEETNGQYKDNILEKGGNNLGISKLVRTASLVE